MMTNDPGHPDVFTMHRHPKQKALVETFIRSCLRLCSGLLILVAVLVTMGQGRAEEQKPNIIVVMADDMGFSDLGCYGGEIGP